MTSRPANAASLLIFFQRFGEACPGTLLGTHGKDFTNGKNLLRRIIDDLTLLEKNSFDANNAAQYLIWSNIIDHVGKLNFVLEKNTPPAKEEWRTLFAEELATYKGDEQTS